MSRTVVGARTDTGPRTVQVLQVTGPGVVEWVDVATGELPEGWIRLDTVASGVSAGTELTFLKGSNPALHAVWDPELGLFRDDPAVAADPYPVRQLGYMQVGRVAASRSRHVPAGALVAAAYGHATGADLDAVAQRWVLLPDGLDPVVGVLVAHMGPICANGLLHAAADLVGPVVPDLGVGVRGRRVLVTGAGVVGLLTAVFADALGAAEVVVADPTPARLAAARALGLGTVDSSADDVGLWCKQRWRHAAADRGADVVFQCRGQAASLATALRALRPQGTVLDLAFYPGGAAEVRLGEEFHHLGLRIVCAQIGRVPRGTAPLWDRERLSAATLDLLATRGAALREHLVTDLVPLADAPGLLTDLADRRRSTLLAVLTTLPSAWTSAADTGAPSSPR